MKNLSKWAVCLAITTSPIAAASAMQPADQVDTAITESVVVADEPVAEEMPAPESKVEQKIGILAAGTPVLLSMDKTLATDKREKIKGQPKLPKGQRRITNMGDTFTMTVVNDVTVDGHVVIPQGSSAVGEVTDLSGRGGFGKSGKIEIQMNYVTVGDQKIALTGTHLQKGKGRGGAAVAGVIVAGVIAGVFIKGDEADIPMSSEYTFNTLEEIEFGYAVKTKAPEEVADAPVVAADAVEAAADAAADAAEAAADAVSEAAVETVADQ